MMRKRLLLRWVYKLIWQTESLGLVVKFCFCPDLNNTKFINRASNSVLRYLYFPPGIILCLFFGQFAEPCISFRNKVAVKIGWIGNGTKGQDILTVFDHLRSRYNI